MDQLSASQRLMAVLAAIPCLNLLSIAGYDRSMSNEYFIKTSKPLVALGIL